VWLPIFANSQDVAALAEEVSKGLATRSQSRGFLLGGHGLYAWGPSLRDARANVVALEFLLNCELEKLRIGPS
jgi:methylthioribulose-1-phosphate dehydratase